MVLGFRCSIETLRARAIFAVFVLAIFQLLLLLVISVEPSLVTIEAVRLAPGRTLELPIAYWRHADPLWMALISLLLYGPIVFPDSQARIRRLIGSFSLGIGGSFAIMGAVATHDGAVSSLIGPACVIGVIIGLAAGLSLDFNRLKKSVLVSLRYLGLMLFWLIFFWGGPLAFFVVGLIAGLLFIASATAFIAWLMLVYPRPA